MGSNVSTVRQPFVPRASEPSWGEVPKSPPPSEVSMSNELVLDAWAHCRAKPSMPSLSVADEQTRVASLQWRRGTGSVIPNCGDDNFFIASTRKAIGIADGVGGWRSRGVNPALFSGSLMEYCNLYIETHRHESDPTRVLEEAHEHVKRDGYVCAGSSTALVATVERETLGWRERTLQVLGMGSTSPPRTLLNISNVGDSSLVVIRDKIPVFEMLRTTHSFNAPYQLAVLPKGNRSSFNDCAAEGARARIELKKGDIIVVGTDGLFDNRFVHDIVNDVEKLSRNNTNALIENAATTSGGSQKRLEKNWEQALPKSFLSYVGAAFDAMKIKGHAQEITLEGVAKRIVDEAYATSQSQLSETPWAMALRQLGRRNASGGKPDDITVIVAQVRERGEITEQQ